MTSNQMLALVICEKISQIPAVVLWVFSPKNTAASIESAIISMRDGLKRVCSFILNCHTLYTITEYDKIMSSNKTVIETVDIRDCLICVLVDRKIHPHFHS